ncbi:MAG: TRAP transporter fused permease subunit [Cloacibacillus sp.]
MLLYKIIHQMQQYLINIIAASLALFTFYTAVFGVYPPSIQRTVHLALAVSLGFLLHGMSDNKQDSPLRMLFNFSGFILSAGILGYFIFRQDVLSDWIPFVSSFGAEELVISITATLVILIIGKRFTGNSLPIIVIIFLVYGHWGEIFPGFLKHSDYTWSRIMEVLYFGFDGVFGIPLGISATIISIFIMFGCFFEISGGGEALMDIGKYVAGRTRGGPAKIAVVASALMGTISGSAVANVYATGTFSIPLMKKLGFKPQFAGAVEACSSTGGQLIPPVMGAAAFVMSDYTGLPYARIALAALIPGFLYYFSLFLSVDFEAAMTGIKGLPPEELPSKECVVKELPLLIPIFVIIAMLGCGYSAMLSGVYAIAATVLISYVTPHKMTLRKIFEALTLSGKRMVMIAVSTAMSGMIIGIVAYTSLGINFLALVVNLPTSIKWMAPIFVAMASIVLGMGVPTTVAYIIVAAIAVPALKQIGFGMIEAHMFAFYFSVLSMITPPVAPASLAASEIAGASFFDTGKVACKIGFVTFLIPFVFLNYPELLFVGNVSDVVMASITSILGVVIFTAGVKGWFLIKLRYYEICLCIIIGILLILPGYQTDLIGAGLAVIVLGLVLHRKKTLNLDAKGGI